MSELNHRLASDVQFNVSAPGKVILYGEHSVVYGKSAIASSLGLRTRLHFFETPATDCVSIEVPAVALTCSCPIEAIQEQLEKLPRIEWQNPQSVEHEKFLTIVEGFVKGLCKDLNAQQLTSLTCTFYLFFGILQSVDLKPFRIKIESDLTVGAGTGSSASFSVVIAAAFLHYLLLKSVKNNRTTFNPDELNIISKWAYSSERICHGRPSGIDNTVCTYGSMVEFRKNTGVEFIATSELELLLINTKQGRSTKQLVDNVAALRGTHKLIVDLVLKTMDEIVKSALDCILEISKGDQKNLKRVYDKLGDLTNMNQCMLQTLGVSHPKLEEICAVLKNIGLCGKLTGAGGGGYAISIIPPYVKREVIEEVTEELISKGYEVILTKLGGSGVTID